MITRPQYISAKDKIRRDTNKVIDCSGLACFVIVFVSLVTVAGVIIGSVALLFGGAHFQSRIYKTSQSLRNSPMGQTLDGSGSPLIIKLPNDLQTSGFIHTTYVITAADAAAHVLEIESGAYLTTFDGGFTKATFDGNPGSTLVYRPVLKNRIHIISMQGVTLS